MSFSLALLGLARLLLVFKGMTVHSWAGIGLGEGSVEELLEGMSSTAKQRWIAAKKLYIEEEGRLSDSLFIKLSEIAQRSRGNTLPMGGIQVLFIL
jgi:ATP-dependent DNA helicase PIF1